MWIWLWKNKFPLENINFPYKHVSCLVILSIFPCTLPITGWHFEIKLANLLNQIYLSLPLMYSSLCSYMTEIVDYWNILLFNNILITDWSVQQKWSPSYKWQWSLLANWQIMWQIQKYFFKILLTLYKCYPQVSVTRRTVMKECYIQWH